MKVLKWVGIFFLCVLFAAVVFALVLLIGSKINNVGFYEQAQLWFGGDSAFGELFKKI